VKKKIIGLTLAGLLAVGGIAGAASMWGKYKGNTIIRLTVGGEPVKVADVPAVSYLGRTMIPIYLLQQAGVEYKWDQRTQTVDITPPSGGGSAELVTKRDMMAAFDAKQYHEFADKVSIEARILENFADQLYAGETFIAESTLLEGYDYLETFLDTPSGNIDLHSPTLTDDDYEFLLNLKYQAEDILITYEAALDALLEAESNLYADEAQFDAAYSEGLEHLYAVIDDAIGLAGTANDYYFEKMVSVIDK
jgi:hypothetical protein